MAENPIKAPIKELPIEVGSRYKKVIINGNTSGIVYMRCYTNDAETDYLQFTFNYGTDIKRIQFVKGTNNVETILFSVEGS